MALKIAMLGWEFPPFISGGLGVHCFELTKALGQRGVLVDFYMPKSQTVPESPHPNVKIIPVDYSSFEGEIDFHDIEFGPYYKFLKTSRSQTATPDSDFVETESESYGLNFFEAVGRYNFLVAKLVEIMHKKRHYDLVHAHDWITAKAGISASKKIGKKLIFTFHSTEFDRTASLSPFDWILEIESQAAKNASHIIAVSNMTRMQVSEKFQVSQNKISVVYNGVDPSKFKSQAKKEHFGITGPVVLFHGRLSIQKGPDFFLKAAKRVLELKPDVRFIISGKGDMLPQLLSESISLGIMDKVTFTGYISDDHLPYLYSVADVYVLPSVSEPFGLTVLEAMVNGVPAIVSKSCGVSEIINHCLRVDFWDVDEMASKILAILKYTELKEMLSDGARAEASHFSWSKTANETLLVYNKNMS
ncbi:glycosyltransferase family 4 protein [Candidatus Micrarchaeota archaeon]|nr:glycosyltransferase family 4 protein [Candidatus Micrarchaeota archaeon]